MVGVHRFTSSGVQGLPASGRFHSRPRTAFGMCIYEKSLSFVRPNPKFGARLAIIWEMSIFNEDFGFLMPSLSLTVSKIPLGINVR
jgi:hypothetical protein